MMWRWHSTSNFTTYNVAYYNLYIYDRKWHFPSAKSTALANLVTMRISAGTNAWPWRKIEGVMGEIDVRISLKRKGNILSSCVTPAYMNALETMALIEKFNRRRSRFAKTTMVRTIVGAKIRETGLNAVEVLSEGKF